MNVKKCSKIPCEGSGIEIKKSICAICDPTTQCGLNLYVKDGKIIKVEGDENQPYGQGTLCPKGSATRQYVYHEDRIKTPLRRTGPRGSGEFTPITWEEAYEEIAEKLLTYKKESGAEATAFFSGYTKFYRPWLKRLCHSYGSPNFITESSCCAKAMALAQELVFGAGAGPDMGGGMGCLIIWSANPMNNNPGNARQILAALDRGMKLIIVDPRNTPTTDKAHIHLRLHAGTDGALALAMAHVIITENLYDKDFVDNYSYGFEEYKNYVMEFTPERGEEITGVPAQQIREAARMFATASSGGIMPSAAPVVHNTNGVQNYRAVFSLIGLTGNYAIKGGQMPSKPSFLHGPGLFESRQDEFNQSRPYSEMATRIGADRFPVWTELVSEESQAMMLPQQIRTGKPYPIRAVVGFGMNYRMWPDSNGMAEALKKLDFVVNVELFMTDTCKLCDIVLPACTTVERTEFRCWGNGWVTCTSPAIEPLFESRPDIDIMCDLAKYIAPEDTLLASGFDATMDWILEPSGLTVAELRKHPSGMFVPNPQRTQPKEYVEKGFDTPSGKFEFVSTVLAKHAMPGCDALPVYNPPKYSHVATPELAKDYPFVLSTGCRLPMYVHTRTYRLPWSASLRPNTPSIDLHPTDAQRMGFKQDDTICVSTPTGSVTVSLNVTRVAHEGAVYLYHGHPQADANSLLEWDYLDPISGFPGYKTALCKLEKVIKE